MGWGDIRKEIRIFRQQLLWLNENFLSLPYFHDGRV
jgi:hypothetical protein